MDVLVFLASRAGEVVSNDEVIEAVWGGRPMSESPVYKTIANLRKALGDDPKAPDYIETIARRGYRLLPLPAAVDDAPAPTGPGIRKTHWLAAAVLLVAGLFATVWLSDRTTVTPPPAESVAVIAFEDLGTGDDTAVLCRGIAEELINRLAGIPDLRVVAPRSAFAFSEDDDHDTIMRKLDVAFLLTGSVQQSGDDLRVSARLIDRAGAVVWTEAFDATSERVFTVQDDIARAVVAGLSLHVNDTFAVSSPSTTNMEAYRAYRLGKELYTRRPVGWLPEARRAFEEAIRIDADYVDAYAGLAMVHNLASMHDASLHADAVAAIERALQIDPDHAEALAVAGVLELAGATEAAYRDAVRMLRTAIDRNSSLVHARNWLSTALNVLGEREESMRVLNDALVIDPLNPILNVNVGVRLHVDGQLDAARAQFRRTLELPDAPSYAWMWGANVEESAGRFDTALDWVKQGVVAGAFDEYANNWQASDIALRYARLGMFDQAQDWLDALRYPVNSPPWIAGHYAVAVQESDVEEIARMLDVAMAGIEGEARLSLPIRNGLGLMLLLTGDYDGVIEYLEPAFPEGWTLHNTAGGSGELIDSMHNLAVAYQRVGRNDSAETLLNAGLERQLEYRVGRTRLTGNTLADEAVTYLLLGDHELAIARFGEAVDAGWRRYYEVREHPAWDGFRDLPGFEELMQRVLEDIESQRRRVIAAESVEPFLPPI